MNINFYIIYLIFLVFLSNCGAYFNTFYNAKKSYDDAEILIDKSNKDDGADIPQQAKKLLAQSIEKSQKVITNHPDSEWIDDSYFLIGKASFVKSDYEYSEKFFKKLLLEYPNSNLLIDTKLWLSYTFLKQNRIDSSLAYINSFKNNDEFKDSHNFLKYTILGEIDLVNKLYNNAYDFFEKSIDYVKRDSKKSSIYEKLVKISESNNDKNKTIYFLDKLNNYAQTNDLKYESKLKWLKYNRELGNLEIVRNDIDKLLARSDYEQIYLSLELEKVKILLFEKKYDLARQNLLYIVENNSKKKETAEAHYLLGLYYLTNEWDLDKAKEYFSNVKIEYSRSIYLDNAIDLKNTIDKYQGLNKIFNSQQAGDTSVVEITIDEEEKVDMSIDLGMNIGGFGPGLAGYSNPNIQMPDFEDENLSSVVIKGTIDSLIFAMGEILYFDFQQLDSAEAKFKYLYDNHPDSKFTPQAIYILSNTVKDSILWEAKLIKEYPNNKFSKALQGIEIEIDDVDLFEAKSDSLWSYIDSNPDSIARKFVMLSEIYDNSKALYSAAFIYDYYLNDISNSQKYYKALIDSFPNSDFFSRSKNRIDIIEKAIKDTIAIIDTLNIANEVYNLDTLENDSLIKMQLSQFPPLPILDGILDSSESDSSIDMQLKQLISVANIDSMNIQNDTNNTKFFEKRIDERIDSLKIEYVQPLQDEIIKQTYEVQNIINWSDHIILKDQTLEEISKMYFNNTSMVDSIFSWNLAILNGTKELIYPYTIIKIKTDQLFDSSIIYNDHIISYGETLWGISQDKLNDPYAWVLLYNDNKNILENGANILKPGMKIKIRELK